MMQSRSILTSTDRSALHSNCCTMVNELRQTKSKEGILIYFLLWIRFSHLRPSSLSCLKEIICTKHHNGNQLSPTTLAWRRERWVSPLFLRSQHERSCCAIWCRKGFVAICRETRMWLPPWQPPPSLDRIVPLPKLFAIHLLLEIESLHVWSSNRAD